MTRYDGSAETADVLDEEALGDDFHGAIIRAPSGPRKTKTRNQSRTTRAPVSVGPSPSPDGESDASEVSFETILDEVRAMAREVHASGVKMSVHHTPGGHLPPPLDRYPNGIGGSTLYGVSFITDWREVHPEPAFVSPSQRDAAAIWRAIEEEKEITWRPMKMRTEDYPSSFSASSSRSDSDDADGDGSSPPSSSSEKHTVSKRRPMSGIKRSRSRRTSSRR